MNAIDSLLKPFDRARSRPGAVRGRRDPNNRTTEPGRVTTASPLGHSSN